METNPSGHSEVNMVAQPVDPTAARAPALATMQVVESVGSGKEDDMEDVIDDFLVSDDSPPKGAKKIRPTTPRTRPHDLTMAVLPTIPQNFKRSFSGLS